MIKLKQVIHYSNTNSVEATWVREIQPAYDVPEQHIPEVQDADGNVLQEARVIPAHTVPAVEEVVRCHSYADVQMDMLEADLGADAAAHADLIATVRANIKPPVIVEPTPIEKLAQLDAENALTQRNLRETIMLMNEAFKQLSGGALDLSKIPGVAAVYTVEAQAKALRSQL